MWVWWVWFVRVAHVHRSQWHRETSTGSNRFIPTNNFFADRPVLARPIPGGMEFDPVLRVFRRLPEPGSGSDTPAPLVFPGDEAKLADVVEAHAEAISNARATAGSAQ